MYNAKCKTVKLPVSFSFATSTDPFLTRHFHNYKFLVIFYLAYLQSTFSFKEKKKKKLNLRKLHSKFTLEGLIAQPNKHKNETTTLLKCQV